MAAYNFESLVVTVVEDNGFIRNTFANLLLSFGIKRITTLKNGEEAINMLKEMKRDQNPGPDILFTDIVMAPINGLLLLRWARTAVDSPNRFVPTVMVSGAADRNYVESARDLGASEFLAKPFSAKAVSDHLMEIIDRPRPFVTTQKFFGPDRRRRKDGPVPSGGERRRTGEDHVTLVYSVDKRVKAKQPSDVWHFHLPNRLREKVGGFGAEAGEFPLDLIDEAETQLERAQFDFTTWAQEYLAQLSELCTQALAETKARSRHFEEMHLLALELRGQGGTFGYPLISTFGKMLFDATVEGCPENNSQVEIAKAHIDAMRAVLRDKVEGDGGEIGRALLQSLQMAIERHQVVR